METTDSSNKRRVALVVPGLISGEGGLSSTSKFLYRVLADAEGYQPDLISLATSKNDSLSVRLLSPRSWLIGVQTAKFEASGMVGVHVGARWAEFEFQRYSPRPALNEILNNYDLVQIIAGSPACALIAKDITRPVVLLAATLVSSERETRLRQLNGYKGTWVRAMTSITNYLDQHALNYVDRVIVINKWMFHYLVKQLGENRVSFAPPGIDTNIFYPTADFAKKGFILSVGRFDDPRKNVRLLFQAYHLVRSQLVDAPDLVLAGRTAPSTSDWNLARELGIADHLQIFENISTVELADLYRQARLFVLSSNEEGLGIVLLEAMATGLPVVATRSGGPETIIDDGVSGFLVPLGDQRSLAEKILTLLKDDSMSKRLGKKGQSIITKNYSIEAAGNIFLSVYGEILGDNKQ